MAITRCPYCHAIIDENDKYCNNCGTQLLFPEDEDVDEEIPGEKIIDAEVEEKDYTVDEPAAEKKPTDIIDLAEDLDEELDEEAEELALDKLVEEGAGGDDVTEEVILVDEIEAAEEAAKEAPGKTGTKEATAELAKADTGKVEDEDEEEEEEDEEAEEEEEEPEEEDEEEEKAGEEEEEGKGPEAEVEAKEYETVPPLRAEAPTGETEEPPAPAAAEREPEVEYITGDKEREEAEAAEEAVGQPVTFDTRELEGMGKTVEISKDKIDKFLEVLAEKRTEAKPVGPKVEPEAEPAAPPPAFREPTGTLPPWASVMKGAPVFADETGRLARDEEEAGAPAPTSGEEEVEIFPRRRAASSTIGLPERVGQSPLPFDRAEAEAEEQEEAEEEEGVGAAGEGPAGEEAEMAPPAAPPSLRDREPLRPAREQERRPLEAEAALEEAGPRPPFSFAVFFKSKAFDFLFVGLFWLVALWLAAHSLGMTLFEILGAMSGSMFLLYVVFLFIYFFLFKFFLGETLGDRLFRERD